MLNGGTMRTFAVAALIALALPANALANDDASACTPDVWRLCSSEIPSRDRIIACLHDNKRKLSPACYQVFNRKTTKDAGRVRTDRPKAAQYEPGSLR